MSCIRVFSDLQTAFIHIPKTGGSTITAHLSQVSETGQEKFWGEIPVVAKPFYRFAMVRDPFDRFISSWSYCTNQGWCPEMPPREFLFFALDNECPTLPPPVPTGQDLCKHHTAPQTTADFLLDQAEDVFRFEDFSSAIATLSERFGFEPGELHLNQSSHEDYRAYYDEELAGLVLEWFAEDFQRLGYDRKIPVR